MDTKELKRTAPELCAKFDELMQFAGRPTMKIGGCEWDDFAKRENADTVTDALLRPLGKVVRDLMEKTDRADAEGKLTQAERLHARLVVNRANEFERAIYAC